jgi:hypothetical protein
MTQALYAHMNKKKKEYGYFFRITSLSTYCSRVIKIHYGIVSFYGLA